MAGNIISAVAAGAALLTTIITLVAVVRQTKGRERNEGHERGSVASDIGYIKAGVDDLKRESRETRSTVSDISERITRVEESTKQAHKRIDELKSS